MGEGGGRAQVLGMREPLDLRHEVEVLPALRCDPLDLREPEAEQLGFMSAFLRARATCLDLGHDGSVLGPGGSISVDEGPVLGARELVDGLPLALR
jgi:hypothetical protein